jgi:Fe/S biogenesis protein NfuA
MSVTEPLLEIDPPARAQLASLAGSAANGGALTRALRVRVTGIAGEAWSHALSLEPLPRGERSDEVIEELEGVVVVLAAADVARVRGARVTWSTNPAGFVVENPNPPQATDPWRVPSAGRALGRAAPPANAEEFPGDPRDATEGEDPSLDTELGRRVAAVLSARINPGIALHGGHAALVAVRDRTAYLRLSGGCQGCGMAARTLGEGIEATLTEAVREIVEVVDVTDHAAGERPYYAPPAPS